MDTLLQIPYKNFTKIIANSLNITIVAGLLFSQHILEGPPILAQELTIAHGAIVSPLFDDEGFAPKVIKELTIEQKIQNFNENIRRKYKKGVIVDVDRGVKHIKLTKYYQGRPVKINVIEINSNINPDLKLTPALASNTLAKKSTITSIAKKNNSIVAINGTFFKPTTGVPLGTLMIDKKMYTGPIYNRVAMGIFDNGYDMARVQLNANLKTKKETIIVDNLNQPRTLSTHVIVYTKDWGNIAPVSPKYGKQIAIQDNKIITASTSQLTIPENGYVVVGPASQLDKIASEKELKLEIATTPEWKDVKHIIGGGPYLVKNGQTYIDVSEQKLGAIGGRNPRSAVGYTADNNLIIVAVDGREESSVGMTLTELANFMQSIGCVNAMNLDGGGSTVMYVNGKIVNQPSIRGGIALSNALVLKNTD